ncbi:MAG: hypothetical protein K9L59_07520 [Desulfobacterales bacterium]|nr:hypothetical protein [Desulfobacterales bacterium]
MTFLRRTKTPERPIYKEAAVVLKTRRHSDALAWLFENLKPEAARMLETCLAAYGPTEALRWVSYWEEKKEPIEKGAETTFGVGGGSLS